uniref:NADH-ubiquinone oxidoreductase chain 4L n=1 Tax=Scolytinae sp. BMNH 1043133 TaxID=1903798 RepID=A0A343A4U6_9CUCU|nr:NADH dehydrogenase subunit 4L [Scolytinae sp. BMNH 1043133]
MYYLSFIFIYLFLVSLLVFILEYKHFLIMLLSLESMVLSFYMLMFIYFTQGLSDYFISMFYLSMSVCEGALGLSLLVLVIRMYGNDMIMMFDNLW